MPIGLHNSTEVKKLEDQCENLERECTALKRQLAEHKQALYVMSHHCGETITLSQDECEHLKDAEDVDCMFVSDALTHQKQLVVF